MTSRSIFGSAFIFLLIALGGCTSVADPTRPPPGSSRAFAQAYHDGCSSGYHDIGHVGFDTNDNARKDTARYADDADYRAGWDQGYRSCWDDDFRTPNRYPGAP